MATTSKVEYKKIKVTGAVSVVRVDRVTYGFRILIMGPTGAGKSSFIEALGLKGSSKISSNGLGGCTQAVSTYKLNNVTRDGYPIYLVDSPGFADTKISEMAIVSMLHKWIEDNNRPYFDRILYLTPITSVRLPGSQRQVLKTFHALTGVKSAKDVTIVTTMWDTIWGEQATKRAEANYQQLQSEIWKTFIEEGAQITQFHNTKESVMSILDQALGSNTTNWFSIEAHRGDIKGSPFEANLLTDLQDRIQNLQSHIPTLRDELTHAEARGDVQLLSTLRLRIKEAEEDLSRFQKELDDSGLLPPPPPPPPLATPAPDAEHHSTSSQAHTTTIRAIKHIRIFDATPPQDVAPPQSAFLIQQAVGVDSTPEGSSSTILPSPPAPISHPDIVPSSTPLSDFPSHVPPIHNITIPAASRSVGEDVRAPSQHAPGLRAPGRFARIMELMKCWGDAVGEHHD